MSFDIREKPRAGWRKWINANTIGMLFLVAAFTASFIQVLYTVSNQANAEGLNREGKKVITIAHWQLELGFRDALQDIIDDYEKLHPDVDIRQNPVTGRIYDVWLNVQLISGTTPDISQSGKTRLSTQPEYIAQFYCPLTQWVAQPNPYNAPPYDNATELISLVDVPWRETFIDGLASVYQTDLQEYYVIPTTMVTSRLYCNRSLLQRATGSDQMPQTLGQLLDACRKIRALAKKEGQNYIPIAGDRTHYVILTSRYMIAFLAGLEDIQDSNLDGYVKPEESYAALLEGKLSLQTPEIKEYFQCMRELFSYFPPKFTAYGPTESKFLFFTGQAGFIATGSWDAGTLFNLAKDKFKIGVLDLPMPGKGERWGDLVAGRTNEASVGGAVQFSIAKASKHPEVAIDFLRYLTSRKGNEKFNQLSQWLPVTLGAKPLPQLLAFMPNPEGYNSRVQFYFKSQNLQSFYKGKMQELLQNDIKDYDVFAQCITEALTKPMGREQLSRGDRAWIDEFELRRKWCRDQDAVLTVQYMRDLMDPSAKNAKEKYRQALSHQLQFNDGEYHRYEFQRVRGRAMPE